MKKIQLLIVSLFVCSIAFAEMEVDEMTMIALKAKVCKAMVAFAKSEGLKSYTLKGCLRNATMEDSSLIYNPDTENDLYEFMFMDEQVAELKATEQWIWCSFEIESPVKDNNPEVSFCNVEG